MKTKQKLMILCLLLAGYCNAQWVVSDPSNLAQGIVNTTKQIIETSTIAGNTLSNFQETVKIYEQGKKYYDALQSVNNLVKDARKVQEAVLLVSEISGIYVDSFQKMLSDPNYSAAEIEAIAEGYTILLRESSNVLSDLTTIINPTSLSMSDKERMDIINNCYDNIRSYRNLILYYTNKTIGVSYVRSKKQGEYERVIELYGNSNQKYW